jgi:deoxyhypusine synthase
MKKNDLLKEVIEHIDIKAIDSTPIIDAMRKMSFTSRDTANATDIYMKMLGEKGCTNILTLAGSTSAAGCMQVYVDMVKNKMVDVVVATGASIIDMDFFEALGYKHYKGTTEISDVTLRELYIDRIYDTFIDEEELQNCDNTIKLIADGLERRPYSSREFIYEIGKWLVKNSKKKDSLIQACYENGVPIFCPAFSDCSAGFGLVKHQVENPDNHVTIDSVRDFWELTKIKIEAKTTGLMMIGGGIWYLFDVTWASGFIQINKGKSTYVKKINLNYLFVDPSEFIKTHMPFDYCWQMLDNPISHKKFYDINDDKDEKFNNLKINYIDSLLVFINASKLEQLNLTLNRTIYAGIYNQLTYNYLNNVKAEIDTYLKNQQINAYNNTINLVNNGNDFINKYVNYFNKQFSPELPEEEVKSLLDSAYNNYKVALFFLENTDNNTIIQNNYSDIINYCKKQIIFVEEQYLFVNQYYSMPKSLRKSLFYIRN